MVKRVLRAFLGVGTLALVSVALPTSAGAEAADTQRYCTWEPAATARSNAVRANLVPGRYGLGLPEPEPPAAVAVLARPHPQ